MHLQITVIFLRIQISHPKRSQEAGKETFREQYKEGWRTRLYQSADKIQVILGHASHLLIPQHVTTLLGNS